MTAHISFSELFTYAADNSTVRLPLDALAHSAGHVHGLLEIEISGRTLPHMGFFGSADVCFNTWVEELSRVVQELGTNASTAYTFDEGEQGQPAFAFERNGDLLYLSVVESPLSGATGDPLYQNVSCAWSEFDAAVSSFFTTFRAVLLEQSPRVGQTWWSEYAKPAI
jgi:hypothetical protein